MALRSGKMDAGLIVVWLFGHPFLTNGDSKTSRMGVFTYHTFWRAGKFSNYLVVAILFIVKQLLSLGQYKEGFIRFSVPILLLRPSFIHSFDIGLRLPFACAHVLIVAAPVLWMAPCLHLQFLNLLSLTHSFWTWNLIMTTFHMIFLFVNYFSLNISCPIGQAPRHHMPVRW